MLEFKNDSPGDGDDATPALAEIKRLITTQGTAWEEFKREHTKLLEAKADGKAISDFEAKLAKLDADLEKSATALDDVLVKMNRPGFETGSGSAAIADETKAFNNARRADAISKGRRVPDEVGADVYTAYKSGFLTLARTGNLDDLSGDERKAMSAGSDPQGGYLLPPSTESRVVSKVYEQSPMRQLATVQPISTDALEGLVDNDETDAGWVSEQGARTGNDGTPDLGKWRIEAAEMYAQPKATQKLIDDASVDVEAWLAGKISAKMSRVEAAAFWSSNGVGKPRGLAAYPTVTTDDDSRTWGQMQHVITGANGAFASTKADPLQDLLGSFRDQYLNGATFVLRREVRTLIRKMKEATSDRYLWEPSLQAGQPDRLLGYPARVDQYMPALATGSLSLAFGDFREAYTVVDRIGIRVLRDPFTSKPYVIFYATKRTGGGAVNFEAVKFLKFTA